MATSGRSKVPERAVGSMGVNITVDAVLGSVGVPINGLKTHHGLS